MQRITIKCKLVAYQKNDYTIYVFEDLNKSLANEHKYIMVTKLPNWDNKEINIGDIGFLEYREVLAGQEYYNPHQQTKVIYKYDNVYYFNFIHEQEKIEQKDYIM